MQSLPEQRIIFRYKHKDHEEKGESYHPDYGDGLACLPGLLVTSVPEASLYVRSGGIVLLAHASVDMPELLFQCLLFRIIVSRLVIEDTVLLCAEKSKTELHNNIMPSRQIN